MSEIFRFPHADRPVLPIERATVFFDGQFSKPRLHHPEGVAIGPDGRVWCGDADGHVVRIAADGSSVETMAETGGFVLGLAFDGDRHLFICEQGEAGLLRLTLATGRLERFGAAPIRIPNYPVVDAARRALYVSDSHAFGTKGPGVWRFDLRTGEGALWWSEPMNFANGMALGEGGAALMVCETFSRLVTRVAIGPDGRPAGRSDYAVDLPALPDGIAFDDQGDLFVACYEPSRILRVRRGGGPAEFYIDDPSAHALCHPTNIAFKGSTLYSANLGRWHITQIATDTSAAPLVSGPKA